MPLSQAQQNLLRQAQEYSQETGQTPDKVTELTAAHGDLTGSKKQRTPPGQRGGAQRRGSPRRRGREHAAVARSQVEAAEAAAARGVAVERFV